MITHIKSKLRSWAAPAASMILLGLAALAAPAGARTNVHISLNLGSRDGYYGPRLIAVPRTHVYYVEDCEDYDVYRCDDYWYACDGEGDWYRGPTCDGPWASIGIDYVPREVIYVPSGYYHYQHYPTREYYRPGYRVQGGGWQGDVYRDRRYYRDDRRTYDNHRRFYHDDRARRYGDYRDDRSYGGGDQRRRDGGDEDDGGRGNGRGNGRWQNGGGGERWKGNGHDNGRHHGHGRGDGDND